MERSYTLLAAADWEPTEREENKIKPVLKPDIPLLGRGQVLDSLSNPSLSDEVTGLLRIQITDLLWNIHQGVELFLVTFLLALFVLAASATDLDWDFLTGSIAHKLSRGLLNVLEDNGRFGQLAE